MTESKKTARVAVIGGDLRQSFCAERLCLDGYETSLFGFENLCSPECAVTKCFFLEDALEGSDAVILPLPALCGEYVSAPYSKKEIPFEKILQGAKPGALILGGNIPKSAENLAKERGFNICDYYRREELQIANAVPTAEGAIAIAINELPITLHRARCLVVGYGRIGKALFLRLSALGAYVTASARKPKDLASIESQSSLPAIKTDDIEKVLPDCDVVFNTVPSIIFDREKLTKLRDDCLVIDLASKPGGVDEQAACELSVKLIRALSLPGKTSPKSAGEIIEKAIVNILCERGLLH